MRFFFLIIFSLSANSALFDYIGYNNSNIYNSSYNSFGQVGLIQTPTADSRPEGTVSLVLNRNDMWKLGTLSVSPFDWLEASYFYYRPSDLIWEGTGVSGHYLDKGFNIKFIYRPQNKAFPNISVGLDDFAGTGLLTREYIVATSGFNNSKFSIGIGWGGFVGDKAFNNPLLKISSSLKNRPSLSDNYELGGKLSYDQWFRGNVSFFGGVEYFIPGIDGLKLKFEYDPFNYLSFTTRNRFDADYNLRKKESDMNFGISYAPNKHLSFDASFIKGNTFNLSFVLSATLNDSLVNKKPFKPNIKRKSLDDKSKPSFYVDLLNNLNENRLFLQASTLYKDKSSNLDISIATSEHRNGIRSSSYAAYIANEVAKNHKINLNSIKVSHINAGVELNNITYIADYLNDESNMPIELQIRNTLLHAGEPNSIQRKKFQPKVNFPVIFSNISPAIISHIGNPEKFFFGGINLQQVGEIQFNRNLLLSTEFNLRLYDNFKDTVSGPASSIQHVRTDLVQYLKNDDLYISRIQLDYIWSPHKNIFAKLSGGIYEPMFGGFGGEVLYRPFDKNLSIGAELFYVRQRSFDQKFHFQKYRTVTGHLNFNYRFIAGIESNLSFGRYLAKDDGFTLDLSRTTKSGFKAGIYFTRTDMPSELFGEGSFDKGFYIQIPLDIFSNKHNGNYSTFKISPLTRDGGAKLIYDKSLRGLIYNASSYELNKQWDGFLN